MSGEEKNKELYKETFEEISVPEQLEENIRTITEGGRKTKGNVLKTVMKKVAIAAAVLVALFVGSNGIAYAMTGNTWMETMMLRLDLKGIEYEVDLTETQTRNGETIYTGIVKEKDGDKSHVHVYEDGQILYVTEPSAVLWSVNGKTYIQDEELEIDVTEQLEKSGYAVGTYEKNGFLKQYAVKKEGDRFTHRVETLHEGMPENDWVTEWLWEDSRDEKTYVSEAMATPTPVPER